MNEVEKRREYIIGRHDDGWTFGRIGEELGVSQVQAGRLYKLGLRDREKREAKAARDAATLGTPVDQLGLPDELTQALLAMGLADLCSILTQDIRRFESKVLQYPNVSRRSLIPLAELRLRIEGEMS